MDLIIEAAGTVLLTISPVLFGAAWDVVFGSKVH